MVDAGMGYSAVNMARSALSAVIRLESGQDFGSISCVSKFMKGVYNIAPPVPKYNHIWDPDMVLELVKKWSPARKLALDKLTQKMIMLILLTTGQ